MYTVRADSHRTASGSDVHPEKYTPEAAEWRINEIAKVTDNQISLLLVLITPSPQELARKNSRSGGEGLIELLELCDHYCTVPALYQLEGVAKEGDHPKSTSQETEIWKGRHNGEVVAIAVLREPEGDSHVRNTKKVSVSGDPQSGG